MCKLVAGAPHPPAFEERAEVREQDGAREAVARHSAASERAARTLEFQFLVPELSMLVRVGLLGPAALAVLVPRFVLLLCLPPARHRWSRIVRRQWTERRRRCPQLDVTIRRLSGRPSATLLARVRGSRVNARHRHPSSSRSRLRTQTKQSATLPFGPFAPPGNRGGGAGANARLELAWSSVCRPHHTVHVPRPLWCFGATPVPGT